MLLQKSSRHDFAQCSSYDQSRARTRRPNPEDIFSTSSSMTLSSRKRPRNGDDELRTPRGSSTAYCDLRTSIATLDTLSPSPLARSDYFLSGGLDTPGAWSEQQLEQACEREAEQDHRPNRFTTSSSSIATKTSTPPYTFHEMTPATNWTVSRTAWALTGGLAGKIFDFCWQTTFSGFRAGSGQGYTDYAQAVTSEHLPLKVEAPVSWKDTGFQSKLRISRGSVQNQTSTKPRYDDSASRNSWIFVEHNHTDDSEHSPVHKRSRASIAGSDRRNSFQPVQLPRQYTASVASPRSRTSSTTLTSRSIHTPKYSRASLASPHSRRTSSIHTLQQSPMSPEIEQFQKKRRKEGKKQDESIRRLNTQLQDMIREGQQALGSRVEVVDDFSNMDEGYYGDEIG